ncbi:MAG TPA: hypothetical protein VEO00_12060 [Actinomycetota bacterium]|nr:hypothetical protein [Actinomycetota bacterium]
MELPRDSLRRLLGLATVALVVVAALVLPPSRQASAADDDCTLTVSGPFLYAGMVSPVIEVRCDSVKQSIRIDAALDSDGSQVATSSRTCRRASSCVTGLADDGIFALDVPGDQRWCGRGSAAIHDRGATYVLPEATSCETESF